eukprot:scaffold44585_cov35-Tisochrysis_lutea.AAC.2
MSGRRTQTRLLHSLRLQDAGLDTVLTAIVTSVIALCLASVRSFSHGSRRCAANTSSKCPATAVAVLCMSASASSGGRPCASRSVSTDATSRPASPHGTMPSQCRMSVWTYSHGRQAFGTTGAAHTGE